MIRAVNGRYILASSAAGLVLYWACLLLKWPVTIFYGVIGGIATLPHYSLPMLIGGLLGRFYFAKKIGHDQWRRYTPILLAGYACGIGLIGMLSIAVALIAKTIYQLVF